MTWEPTIFSDTWADDVRLRVDGRDVTYFRGVPVQSGGYQLQEPYAYGPADFSFPQITVFEVDQHGTAPLEWLRHGADAVLRPVVDGAYGDPLWAGIITSIGVSTDGTTIHCDGAVSGRLALRDRQPPVFAWKRDLGLVVFDAMETCGMSLFPYLGPVTGIERFNTGGGTDYLSFVDEVLASALTDDGGQWTLARGTAGAGYTMRLKDRTTVTASVFAGAYGVDVDVTRDLAEEPTTIYGTGTDPTGQKITNPRLPNLIAGPAAAYPMTGGGTFGVGTTDADTDTGSGMYALNRKLVGMGYLTRDEGADNVYDADTVDAVRALQRDAGLTVTGEMNPATWDALFSVTVTGRTLIGARVVPMAQLSDVQRYFYTANGSVGAANDGFDPDRVVVDRTIDWGAGVWKARMLKASRQLLDQVTAAKNWVGTITLTGADVFTGDIDSDTVTPTAMSRLALREGDNISVPNFDGGTLFHISGINVSGDRNVTLAVDTRFRDLLTIGQIIARNKESRSNPARAFITHARHPNALDTMVVSNELFGLVDEWPLNGGHWNQVMIPCGQSGTIDRVRLHLRESECEFIAAVTVKPVSPGTMDSIAGSNPLDTGSKWVKGNVQHYLKNSWLFLYTAGQAKQPLGYYPRAHRGDNDVVTDAPITGDWEDDAGFAFRTFRSDENRISGVLYLMIYPASDCVLRAGKVLFVNQTEGA